MVNLQDDFGGRLRSLTLVLLRKLHEQLNENEEFFQVGNLDEYRKDLAEADPEAARRFEQMTIEDRKEAMKQLAMVEAIAYAILYALEK